MNRWTTVVVVAVGLALGGCGTGTQTPSRPQHPKLFIEWDDSSFTQFAPSYEPELTRAIQQVAAARGTVFTAVLDGQPLTTASITERNFAQAPPGVGSGELPDIIQAAATGFAHNYVATLTQREIVRGSGQLQGLQLAASTPGVDDILMFTDAVINEPNDGFDLSTATPAEVAAEIARWRPKLKALKGKTVTIVGVGRGIHLVITLERAHQIFHALVDGNGGHLRWTPTLGQLNSGT